ncbi:hypothetical protein BRDID11002_50360 [Bradyrhizobium diazoefficiens]
MRSLSRLRERVGERVSPQRDSPLEERALTRAFGANLSRKRERWSAPPSRRQLDSHYERNTGLLQRSGMGLLRKHELTSSASLRQMNAGSR